MITRLKHIAVFIAFLSLIFTVSCSSKSAKNNQEPSDSSSNSAPSAVTKGSGIGPSQLPIRYQGPSYITAKDSGIDPLGDPSGEYQIKVGKSDRSHVVL